MWSYGCWHDTQSISFIFDEIWSFYSTKLLSRASFLRQVDATVHNLDWPSTTWIDRLHPGPTVYIWRFATGYVRDRLSTYKGPQLLIYKSPQPVTYKGRSQLNTKVANSYIQRVATDYIQRVAIGSIWKSLFLFLKKVDLSVPNRLKTRILQILPIFY